MDVDHAEEPILIIGTGGASVEIETPTLSVIIRDVGGITAGTLTGTTTGDIATGRWTVTEAGVAAAVRRRQL